MPGLPPDLYKRVCTALIDSGYCDSAAALRRLFVDARLAPWRDRLPDADAPRGRAEAVIDALWDQHTTGGDNALALLFHTLSKCFEPGDARCQTLADLAAECEAADRDTTPFSHARLHTLPPPPADFTGREKELETLCRAVETGGALITGLRGMGGVGKTTLALKLAQRLTPRYPDAQFYLDLRGVDPHPLPPADVMTAILRAYYPTARLPEDEAQLQPLYRSVLDGQRALLLLDNAADAAQLRPLLPPASCLLLVTSRQRFTLPGLRALDLDALPKPDAEKLLREIAPRVGDHAGTLADLCGCLPLALRWAGEALNDTTLAVPRYLERLQTERRLLEPAEAALRLSYDLLPPDLQALWRRLSVFPADFDWLGAAAVWDMAWDTEEGRAAAEDALDALARRSLVLLRPVSDRAGENRYALHDLARLWAAEQATDDERATAAYRHAAHYEQVLRAANTAYLQGNEGILAGLALYDREAANIHAGQKRMADLMIEDLEIAKPSSQSLVPNPQSLNLTSEYPDAGAYILDLRLHPRERIRWLEAALRAARALGNRAMEGVHLGSLGLAYADLGDARRAIECYEQALEIEKEIGDRRAEGSILGNLGAAYYALGDARRAIACYEQALEIEKEIGDRRAEGSILGNLGNAYADLGDARRAIEFYEQRLVIAREIGDRRGEGNALGNLGLAYAALGDARRAIEFYEQALVIDREIGDRRGEGNALGNLGNAHYALGDARRAIEFYEQALAIDREIGDRRGEGADLGNLGIAYADLGDARRAIAFYEQSLAIKREIGDRRGEGADLGNLGIAYADLGDARRAIEFYEQCLQLHREIGDRRGEGNALGNLGNAHYALGDARRAIEFYEQCLQLHREIGDRRGEGNALGNLGNAYAALGDARRAIEFYEQRLAIAREIGDRRGEGNALGNLGNAYADLGDARRAIEFYEQALVIDREIGDRRGEGNALGNLGLAYADLGDARRAIAFYEQSLAIKREIGDRRGEGADLGNLGIAYADLGDARRAIEFYEQCLQLHREIGDRRGEGNALGNLGNAHYALGDARRAIECYEQALVIDREIGDRRGEGNALGNLGNAYADLGDARRAIEFYEQQLVIVREIGDRRGESIASWNLGLAYEKQGRYAEACELMRVTVEFERAIGHPDAEPDAQRLAEVCAKA
ncbi:MAG TPA: tetratricopeptide repeat protein [Anaerolineae bacterium]|nr:tetratricopeptide repeat protein [Anaerolineae bacterium]